MQKKYLLLYGGTTTDGEHFDHETLLRFHRVVEFVSLNPAQYTIVLAAGYRPDKPNYRPQKFIAKETLEMLCKELPSPPDILVLDEDVWSTFEESVAVSKLLRLLNSRDVFLCSTWTHLLRIRVIWKIVAPDINVKTIGAKSTRVFYSILWEVGGFIKLIHRIQIWNR